MQVAPPSLHLFLLKRLLWPLLIVVILDVCASYAVALHYADQAYDRWLVDSARSLAHQVKSIKDKPTLELPSPAIELFRWDSMDRTYFRVDSAELGLIAGDPALYPPLVGEIADDQPIFSNGQIQGEELRAVSVYITPEHDDQRVLVTVAETLNKRRSIIRELLAAVMLPQIVLVILSVFHVWRGIRLGLRPLAHLNSMIEKRSVRDLTPISEENVPLEVTALIHTINALLHQLNEALEGQRRFIANAAHQLRTPLAGLKLQIERLLRHEKRPDTLIELHQVEASAKRMSHLTDQLLALAQSEISIRDGIRFHPINLVQLVRESAIDWAPRAIASNVDISLETELTDAPIMGEPVLLQELLGNLLENAIIYGGDRGKVTIALSEHNSKNHWLLIVKDCGPGIPEDERERVFERFYRIPGSTSEGCGLGLSIVKEIAALHHAMVQIRQSNTRGTVIELLVPRDLAR